MSSIFEALGKQFDLIHYFQEALLSNRTSVLYTLISVLRSAAIPSFDFTRLTIRVV